MTVSIRPRRQGQSRLLKHHAEVCNPRPCLTLFSAPVAVWIAGKVASFASRPRDFPCYLEILPDNII